VHFVDNQAIDTSSTQRMQKRIPAKALRRCIDQAKATIRYPFQATALFRSIRKVADVYNSIT